MVENFTKLKLIRETFTPKSTIGRLFFDNVFECFVLEDTIRNVKVQNETAIPYGTYEVVITYSNRFKKDKPLLLKVHDFEGVRFHSGNTDKDTEGCLLVGTGKLTDMVINSRVAFNIFMPKLEEALKKGRVFLEIV